MTSDIAHIILRFSPIEMEIYLQIGGDLPQSLERDWLRRQVHRAEAVRAVANLNGHIEVMDHLERSEAAA